MRPPKPMVNLNRQIDLLRPPTVETDFLKYLFQVQTKPNGGIYEFEIEIEKNVVQRRREQQQQRSTIINYFKYLPALTNNLISRINKYGNDEHCIHDDFPDLRKFCFCKIKFEGRINEK